MSHFATVSFMNNQAVQSVTVYYVQDVLTISLLFVFFNSLNWIYSFFLLVSLQFFTSIAYSLTRYDDDASC